MSRDELRRIQRVKVCCRVDVRDRFGAWTAVTDDVCSRGCRLVTGKLPRLGSVLDLTISSDLIPELLEVAAEVAWISELRIGATFVASRARRGALSPVEWIERLVEHGRVLGPEPLGSEVPRVVPVIRRPGSGQPLAHLRPEHEAEPRDGAVADDVLIFPVRQR